MTRQNKKCHNQKEFEIRNESQRKKNVLKFSCETTKWKLKNQKQIYLNVTKEQKNCKIAGKLW